MYWFDPQLGRRRRALMRDQIVGALSRVDDCMSMTFRDTSHRVQGLVAETRSLLSADSRDDHLIVERIRSKMGHHVSHPHAIHVASKGGHVTLTGPILRSEFEDLLHCVRGVRGVVDVENRLDVHDQAGTIAALQGGRKRSGERMELLQSNWAPATRLLVGTAGSALVLRGLRQEFPVACITGTAGLVLLVRSITNIDFQRLVGIGGGRRAMEVQKTITIRAPISEVFDFWSTYENFPRFMAKLIGVRNLGQGRSHWVASGPAGIPVSWTAVFTRVVPNEILAWRSEPGSVIANSGIIRFEKLDEWSTRLDIHLSYNPPGGALGHFAAVLFGADPKSAMDEDLVRLKSLLEEGKASAPGKRLTMNELAPEPVGTPTL
jgi:uncharacterized membrane protein